MFGWLKELYDIQHQRQLNKVNELDSHNEVVRTEAVCASCETLKMQLAIANQHVEKLMDRLMTPPVPVIHAQPSEMKPVPLMKSHTSWNVRRQMMEENERATARLNREKDAEIKDAVARTEKVEEELGIKHESSS